MNNSLARYLPCGLVPGITLGVPETASAPSWQGLLGLDECARRRGHAMLCQPGTPSGQPVDVFRLPLSVRSKLFSMVLRTPHLVWLLLTSDFSLLAPRLNAVGLRYLPDNVAIVATCYDQVSYDEQVAALCQVEATWRVMAITRPIRAFDLRLEHYVGLSQITVTGGALPGSIPLHPLWLQRWLEQARFAGVPLDFQSWGTYAPLAEHSANSSAPRIRYLPNGKSSLNLRPHPNDDPAWVGLRLGAMRSGCRYQGSEHHEQPDYDYVFRRVVAQDGRPL